MFVLRPSSTPGRILQNQTGYLEYRIPWSINGLEIECVHLRHHIASSRKGSARRRLWIWISFTSTKLDSKSLYFLPSSSPSIWKKIANSTWILSQYYFSRVWSWLHYFLKKILIQTGLIAKNFMHRGDTKKQFIYICNERRDLNMSIYVVKMPNYEKNK